MAGVIYRIGCISSGAMSNMLGNIITLIADDILIPVNAKGTPQILPLFFTVFFSFLYSSNGIIRSDSTADEFE